jgi:hypothetical protein
MLSPETVTLIGLTVAAGILGVVVGYLLFALRERRRERLVPLGVSTPGGGTRLLTEEGFERSYARLSGKVVGGLKEAILGNIGALRREVGQVTEKLGALEVVLRDAIGRIERDRAEQRQERVLTEEGKHRMHAEVLSLHKAIQVLAASVERVEKIWSS